MITWTPQPTQDGSYTFSSAEFGETFHSRQGAKTEAFQKFVAATDLCQKATQPTLRLLDICYGLGYNTAAALESIWRVNPSCRVEVYGLELDATVPVGAAIPEVLNGWSNGVQDVLRDLARTHTCQRENLSAHLPIGDARQGIQQLVRQRFEADAIFLDPFSPRRCPQLWTVEFLGMVAKCLAADGKLSTYSRSAAVRTALLAAGLCIGTIPLSQSQGSSHEWSQGTVAAWRSQTLFPLSQMEREHLQTRAAIPYRDPSLSDGAAAIAARHQQEQAQTQLESTSSWRRRWGIR
ncbi:tRNA (5-methylaminomethyl-2-thiouridine)(34)-methyltransferase MnmD [Altericista sp. CCNU0014]|uniref:tRNA (5-methylaminomethyl-2-thiouridine)(34)-methyltransferase MnmD n=1 Tax=Altericista sp. CCNU0014 TaxID=3082949 RepID=UPI00384A8F75